jgi:hypothetical protein
MLQKINLFVTTPCIYIGVAAQLKLFLTSEVDGDEWSDSSPGLLMHRERTLLFFEQEAVCAQESVWTFWRKCRSFSLAEIQTANV